MTPISDVTITSRNYGYLYCHILKIAQVFMNIVQLKRFLLLLPLVVSACSTSNPAFKNTSEPTLSESFTQSENVEESTKSVAIMPVDNQQAIDFKQSGTGKLLADSPALKTATTETANGDITLNFQRADLAGFLQLVLSDILQVNYALDEAVTGTVTIQTPTALNKQQLIPLVEDILALNNAVMVDKNGFYQILPKEKASGVQSFSGKTSVSKNGFQEIIEIQPLRYIAASEMRNLLEPYAEDNIQMEVNNQRNLLILKGEARDVANMRELIALFDVDWLKGMSIGLFQLENSDAQSLETELSSVFEGLANNNDTTAVSESISTPLKFVAIERLNAILVISASQQTLNEAENWIKRLDTDQDQTKQRLYVYKVQNAKATELAAVIGGVFGNSQSVNEQASPSQTQQTSRNSNLAPGAIPAIVGNADTPISALNDQPANNFEVMPPLNRQQSPTDSTTQHRFITPISDDPVEVIADDVRNALVIKATPKDYEMVAATLEQLDTVPLQVLIEASIIEVSLTDQLDFGVEWFFKDNFGDKQGIGSLDIGDPGIGANTPGFSFTVVDSLSNVRLALNALATESDVNVLSSPSLMVLDNQTARINVGDEIPVPSRQSVSNVDPTAPTVNEIEFRKTGVTLTVTPRVNNSGLVTMEIQQEVSNAVQTTSSSIDAPTIQQRQIDSVVAINSGETIVLGGLIQNSQSDTSSGVPGLHKLPLIGNLFGREIDDLRRTELLVLITPRVVRDKQSARDITREFRKKLIGLQPVNFESEVN